MAMASGGSNRTRLHDLLAVGQSPWYDTISRGILESGELKGLVDSGITGLTSNPTIFEKALGTGSDYDKSLGKLLDSEPWAIFEALAVEDIQAAADLLRPVFDETEGRDGYVSIEVSPLLAADTEGTVKEARRLWKTVNRPNLLVKVPATQEGIPAVATLLGEGINVNVTLIFALNTHEQVMDAYLEGLEALDAAGKPVSKAASVASFFVSRVDTAVDKQLDAMMSSVGDGVHRERLAQLRGQAAISNAVRAYALFKKVFAGPRFAALAAKGARVQRPLWASTGTKDPAYSDIYYVDSLAGPDTVNTMPHQTVVAFLDHGSIAPRLGELDWANDVVEELSTVGINLNQVTEQLLKEGVGSFSKSFETLVQGITSKRDALKSGAGVKR